MDNTKSLMINKNNRSLYIDIVKGIAIILVVFGHGIEYYSDEYLAGNLFYSDKLHNIIYAFHMPLFMLVSGYLFYGSVVRHSWRQNLKTRFTKLILPVILWNTIYLGIVNVVNLIKGINIPWIEEFLSYFTVLWFLWAVFWCSLIVLFVVRCFHDNIMVYVVLWPLMLLLPGLYGINLYVYMYPFFVVGYLWNKFHVWNRIEYKLKSYTGVIIFIFFSVLFVFLLQRYTAEDYIYISSGSILKGIKTSHPYIDWHELSIDLYRCLIGFVGSVVVLMIIRYLYLKNESAPLARLLANLGMKSLGIYVISVLFINNFILSHLNFDTGINYLIVALEAIGVLFTTFYIINFIEKYSFPRQYLLGGR